MKSLSREEIIQKDKQYVWHPYTQMKEYREEIDPLVIEKAKGVFLYDLNGTRYFDGNSSWWVNNLGHSNQRLTDKLKEQIDTLQHCSLAGITHETASLLGERLVKICPSGLEKVFYSDDGSTAVEVAVKMAFQYCQQNSRTNRTKFVTFTNAFHGETIGAVSVSGIDLFHKLFEPLLFDSLKIPSPTCYRCPAAKQQDSCSLECFDLAEQILKQNVDTIAAVIVEPLVQGAAGMVIYPAKYLEKLRALTSKLDIFLIADEVFTGFGRTGKLFACEHANIAPDFICLSKGLTGGTLPFAATLTTDRIFQGFYADIAEQKTFYYGHSYCGNPLGAALALEVIDIFEDEQIIQKIQPQIATLKILLEEFKKLDIVGDIRQIGLIAAIEIVANKETKTPFPSERRLGKSFYEEALRKGAYLRPLGDIIYFVPPLIIKNHELKELVGIACQALETISTRNL